MECGEDYILLKGDITKYELMFYDERESQMKVLVLGPSAKKSKGGMSTVIGEMKDDKNLCEEFNMDFYESYIDGNKLKVLCFSLYSYLRFCFTGMAKKYDIYHIHAASYGSTFRKLLYIKNIKKYNKKIIFHIHGAEYMKFFEGLSEKNKKKVIDMLNSMDVVVALSDDWKEKFEKTFGISNCVVIENGINMERLAPAISDIAEHRHTMVALGRLGKRKGTYDLINAIELVVKDIPDLKVYLAGDGEIEEVKRVVQQKKIVENVKIIGWIGFEKKLDILRKSVVLLLPSYNEGLPMAILEGMACGKGIISTTVGAIPEVINEKNGILINAGDIKGLAYAIIKLSQDDIMLKNMSKNNIKKIEDIYSVNIMHKKIRNVYLNKNI